MVAGGRAQLAGRHHRQAGRDHKFDPVSGAPGRQPGAAARRVTGHVVSDEDRLSTGLGGQPHHLGDRLPVADDQVTAAFAEPIAQAGERIRQETGPAWRGHQPGVRDEDRDYPLGLRACRGERRVVVYPQVTGEDNDGCLHPSSLPHEHAIRP